MNAIKESEPRPSNGAFNQEYREVLSSFRALTDIRFRLLAFMPIGTAGGAALALSLREGIGLGISLFGLVVTLALMIYNARNDQLYNEFVGRAADLEHKMGVTDGYFGHRPAAYSKVRLLSSQWPNWLSNPFTSRVQHGAGVGLL